MLNAFHETASHHWRHDEQSKPESWAFDGTVLDPRVPGCIQPLAGPALAESQPKRAAQQPFATYRATNI